MEYFISDYRLRLLRHFNVKRWGGLIREISGGSAAEMKWGFEENSDTAEEALKDLCVSFQRAGRDGAMQLCGLIVRRHKYMRGLAVKAAQSISAPRRGSGSFTCVRCSK